MPEHQEATQSKILIVEDEAVIALDLKSHLEQMGYTVLACVDSAEKALELIEQDPPDLVLMDIVLKGKMDGIEAADIIHSRWGIPVVFCTAYADRDRLKRAKLVYPFGYIIKPFQDNDIKVTVEMALYVFRVDRERRKAEEALCKIKKNLLDAEKIAHVGFWDLNVVTGDLYWSDEVYRIYGFEPQEFVPTYEKFQSILFPEDREIVQEKVDAALKGDADYDIDFRFVRSDGKICWLHCEGEVTRDEADNAVRFFGVQIDITERNNLIKNIELHSAIMETVVEGIFLIGVDDKIIKWTNRKFETMFGYNPGEMIGMRVDRINAPTDKTPTETRISIVDVLLENGEGHGEFENIKKDGTHFWCYINFSLFDHPNFGRVMVSYHIDITERKRAEEALRESQQIIERIINAIPVRVFWKDKNLVFLGCNAEFARDAGFADPKDIIGKDDYQMGWRDQAELYRGDDRQVIESGCSKFLIEEPQTTPEGNTITLLTSKTPLCSSNGEICGVLGTYMDITDRKQAEEKIKTLLEEKELLLREVHHRIKNNMSTMMSLLSLQSKTLKDPKAVAALGDAKSRLQSMGVLYDKLYRTENLREMSTKEYLPALVDEIIAVFPNKASVKIETRIDDFILGVKILSPLGIIVNEILTNAMKHAFTGRDDGMITVSATIKDHLATLVIEDNGNGIPESITIETSGGFGLQLVDMLTQQIDGTIKIERGKGTRFVLEFKRQ